MWQDCQCRIQKLSILECEGISLVKQLQDSLDGEELVEALTVMRLIWLRRTSFMFNGEFTTLTQLLTKAKELVEFFQESTQGGLLRGKLWYRLLPSGLRVQGVG